MKALSQTFVLMLASIALASCGGGGGGSNSAFTPSSVKISVSAASNSITTNAFTTLTVTVSNQNGSPVANGTSVSASLTPTTIGTLSGSGNASGATATNTTSGGNTSFIFNSSNQAGTAHITVSTSVGSSTDSKSIDITVTAGNGQDPRLQLDAGTTTLPINPLPYDPANGVCPATFLGSPYVSEVTVTWRHSNGQLVTGTSTVNVSVAPTSVMAFSTLVTSSSGNSSNPCSDQFHTLLGSGPVNVTGGVGTIYITSGSVPGTGTLSVTAIDPDNGQTISSQLAIKVAGPASSLPTSISASAEGAAYVSGSSGPQSTPVDALVTDGNGAVVPNPDGYDNVQFQITGPSGTDSRLTGVNAGGTSHTGATVSTVTHNGVASVTFLSGTEQGSVQVKATTDRADGNVDNGIQDGVTATATVVVSDGKLFSLKITNPTNNPDVLPVTSDTTSSGPSSSMPVYTVAVTVLGTDRQGNPALDGTPINFGLIDAPVVGFPDAGSGTFELSGNDGNPQEGGKLFTAPTGAFTTAGGGAGPGDSLVVFGKDVTGDADLESARSVQAINNATSLNVSQAFNLNDTTGSSVNTGSNIPYVIGRATAGNIDALGYIGLDADGNVVLNQGEAQVNLHYPQSRIGQSAIVWAQGTGGIQSGNSVAKTVADAVYLRYLGVGPATLYAVPQTIFGNTTQTVDACLEDAAGSPIPGVTISFMFTNLNGATGTADGKTAGTLTHPTGADGCSTATVVTSGIQPGAGAQIVFSVDDLTASVDITVGSAVLTAVPTYIVSEAGTATETDQITLTLKDGLGNLVPNATIAGQCTSSGGIISLDASSYLTNTNGVAYSTISTTNFCGPAPTPTATCVYTYSQGDVTASASVNVAGATTGGPSPQVVCQDL